MRIAIAALFAIGCSSETSPPSADAAAVDTGTAVEETSADTGAADTRPAEVGPPSMECVTHCACMAENCQKYSRYPYKSEGECLAHCAMFTAAQYKCWFYFCGQAKTAATMNEHWCEHAWGTWGLEECPK
jgi:hypothetical protein